MLHPVISLSLASCLTSLVMAAPQGPLLTEFLASNDSVLLDEDNESSDWIELYNVPGMGVVDLGGWALTDDASDPFKWTFAPGTLLSPGAFLIVFASDKDRTDPAGTLHTNFKLSSSGEYLSLNDSSGNAVTAYAPSFPVQFEDVSYGLEFNPLPTAVQYYFPTPSPSGPNAGGGPPAYDLTHAPPVPTDTQHLVVTVEVPGRLGPTGSVSLEWQVMYQTPQATPMRDDGVVPDALAGDSRYTARILAGASNPGEMIRYKAVVSDSNGGVTNLPLFHDPLGSPEFQGTVVSDPSLNSQLPIWQWFVQNPALANTSSGTRCSIFIDGVFYDNVEVHRRGGSSDGYPRKSYKFDFNPDFRPAPALLGEEIDEANINTHWADKAHLRQHLSYFLYEQLGAPTSRSFPVRMEQNGNFFSVQTFVEEPDRFLLNRLGLDPNGALYKMYNVLNSSSAGVEKVTRTFENNQDLQDLVSALATGGAGMESYLFDNVDVPAVLSYLVATWVMHDNDHVHKNYFLYRDTEGDGEWLFLPWDKDLTWGRNYTIQGGVLNDTIWYDLYPVSHPLMGDHFHPKIDGFWNRLIDRVYENPRLRAMFLRRLRTVCDEFLQPPATPAGQLWLEAVIGALHTRMSPDVALDQAAWGLPTWGVPRTFQQAKDRLVSDYIENRRDYLYSTQVVGAGGIVPAVEPALKRLSFLSIEHSPASGNQSEEYIEILNQSSTAIDLSDCILSGAAQMVLPKGTVIESFGRLYLSPDVPAFRARATAPTGGLGYYVLGPYSGDLDPGEELMLFDKSGTDAYVRSGI